jgi:fructokinase
MGHMRLARHPDDHFEGACPFHRDCLEGLASGTAMKKRWNVPAQELPADHPGWRIEAHYLAQACCNVLMVAPPERIILGGGVNHQPALLALVRDELRKLLNGYLNYDQLSGQLESYLVSPELGDDAGILGCVALGQQYLSLS